MAKNNRVLGPSNDPPALRPRRSVVEHEEERAAEARARPDSERGRPEFAGPDDERGPELKIPRGNASHADWAGFVRHQNYPGDPQQAGRDELRDWFRSIHGGPDDDDPEAAGTATDDGPPADAAAASGGDGADEATEDG